MRKLAGPLLLIVSAGLCLFFLAHHPSSTSPARTTTAAAAPPVVRTTETAPPSAPTPAPASPPATRPHGRSTDPGNGQDGDMGRPVPADAAATPGTRADAARFADTQRRAVAFMHAFARPATAAARAAWWTRVRALLSPRAVPDYTDTDPANVPFTHVTGTAAVMPSTAPPDLLTVVRVPTDHGPYRVELEHLPTGWFVTLARPDPTLGGGRP